MDKAGDGQLERKILTGMLTQEPASDSGRQRAEHIIRIIQIIPGSSAGAAGEPFEV